MRIQNLLLLLTGMLALPALAGEKTLIGDLTEVEHGGFGGPVVRFTQINGEIGVLTGGRGGWIIDHRFVLGGGGFGLANRIDIQVPDATGATTEAKLEMGYGGGMVEVIITSDELIHFSVECLVGAGGLTSPDYPGEDDAFFALEPGANLILNITKFFRFGLGASYRYIAGASYKGIDSSDLSGPSAVVTFKFGSF